MEVPFGPPTTQPTRRASAVNCDRYSCGIVSASLPQWVDLSTLLKMRFCGWGCMGPGLKQGGKSNMSGPAASAVSGRRRRGLQWQADDQAHQSISIQAGHRGNDWLIVFCDRIA